MIKRVGVISIDLKRLKGEFGSKALGFSGNNFGNMLFTNAVYNQIPNCSYIGFSFDPVKVSASFDHIVIPASNWVNKKEDWGFLAELIEKTSLPVTIVGLGSQLDNIDDIHDIAAGTKKFLYIISQRSTSIGVRGEFTKSALNSLGISNVTSLGCPSIFTRLSVPKLRLNFQGRKIRLGVGPTRYNLASSYQPISSDKQRHLYQYAIKNACSIYYQSEAFEISYLNREVLKEDLESALQYYGIEDKNTFHELIMQKGKYHKDLDQWISDVVKDDLYIGTRIHGAVAAIISGTPAILITHDNRTRELASTMGIPSIDIEDFNISMLEDIELFLSNFEFDSMNAVLAENVEKFRDFYKLNFLDSII